MNLSTSPCCPGLKIGWHKWLHKWQLCKRTEGLVRSPPSHGGHGMGPEGGTGRQPLSRR